MKTLSPFSEYYVICIECGEPAAVRLSRIRGIQIKHICCSNETCIWFAKWSTERVWGLANCQGHVARLEAGVSWTD